MTQLSSGAVRSARRERRQNRSYRPSSRRRGLILIVISAATGFGGLCSTKKTIVLCMGSDPEPDHLGAILYCQRPVMQPDTHGPQMPQFLEVQRRMVRILVQRRVATIRELLHLRGQSVVTSSEAGLARCLIDRCSALPANHATPLP